MASNSGKLGSRRIASSMSTFFPRTPTATVIGFARRGAQVKSTP
jgi:hypothetical protein